MCFIKIYTLRIAYWFIIAEIFAACKGKFFGGVVDKKLGVWYYGGMKGDFL